MKSEQNWFLYLVALLLSSCGSAGPDTHRDAEIKKIVSEGRTAPEMVKALTSNGFACDRSTDTSPHYDCTKTTQHFIPPYTCIDRVRFVDSGGLAKEIEVVPAACAGF
jgi:hypothetical protein